MGFKNQPAPKKKGTTEAKPIMGYIILKKPGEEPTLATISTKEVGYETLRQAVEGYIECMHVGDVPGGKSIDIWINEEGKLNGMKPNLQLPGDVVCGPILICLGTKGGKSIPFPDFISAMNIAQQTLKFHIEDPDSVEVPEPTITISTFDSFEDLKKQMEDDKNGK